ncbi:hypothetical protein STEPF1_06297 [Streptomyces sp. F-1]|nr:hypothetical protein STEPF1_06297 [Streptomyces sp. F-1]
MTEHTAEAALAHNASPALRLGGARPSAETAALLADRTTDPAAATRRLRRRSDERALAYQRFVRPDRRVGGRTSANRGHPPAEAGPEAAASAAAITCRNPSVSASASGAVFGSKVHWEIRPVIRVT